METGNNRLDDHIKQRLENLEPAFNEAHWSQFEQLLNAEENLEVDGIITASLGNFEAKAAMPNWNLMEEKLDAEGLSASPEVDDLTYQKLNNYEAKYESSHWELMAKRLEEEFSLRRKLYKYKVFELTLMLLLLFTFINYMPFGGNKIQELREWKKEHFDKDIPAKKNHKNPIASAPIAAAASPINEVYNTGIETKEIGLLENKIQERQQKLAALSNRMMQTKPEFLPQKFNIIELNDDSTPKIGLAFGSFNLQEGDINLNKNLAKTSILAALDIPKTNVLNNIVDFPAMIFEPNKPKGLWKMSFFINSDINYIVSDDVPKLSAKRDTTLGFGYGGGLMIGYKKGKLGIEFGGQYSYKKYPPNTDSRITNQPGNPNALFIENLKNIQLDILQIPLNVQYYVVDKSKWKFYTTAGASLHLIALPVYQIESQVQSFHAAPAPPGAEPNNSNSFKQSSEFPEGIFSGGSFKQNSYFSANIGFGVEGAFSPRWSIYAQPSYQHYFSKDGIKPFKDKFYTLSFSLGTRVNLN